ncbi:Transcription factor [Coemansia sp. RSA 1822]|nr:Transcription factor [Coemansia sp. RSA 638]KAJ2121527.1 Transcription factor [Coemansia sp. RSA 720]KAJ2560436.1 Transcription factor [Coemansia sp. RSA 1822]
MALHKRRRSKLALEPNPFEESFSLLRTTDVATGAPASDTESVEHKDLSLPAHGAGLKSRGERRHSHESKPETERPSSTPVGERQTGSSGPSTGSSGQRITLPPVAALNGPMTESDAWGSESLRSGPLSPAMLGGPTEPTRSGRSHLNVSGPEHTGLTPFLAGEAGNPTSLRMQSDVVTPGLQAMIHAAFGGKEVTATPGGSLRLTEVHMPDTVPSNESKMDANESEQPVAEHEATHSEEPGPSSGTNGRRAKRRAMQPPPQAKRSRPSANNGNTADGTDDDKRRQFLERNRVAALKCRQRKKRQVQELQERHDYMMSENERLRTEYTHMRETALHVRALLAAHSECASARSHGVFGADSLPMNTPSVSLRPLLVPQLGVEGERAQEIIAAIPPASNGVPVHDVDVAANKQMVSRMPVLRPGSAYL